MSNEVSIFHFIAGFVCGHLCGSIPSGLWIVRSLFGIDIREYGSKNIGTTNVFRTVGAKAALLVLIIDVIKGILAVAAMNYLFADPLLNVVTALGALLGHNYSAFLGFKGGKGVATGLGLLVYLMPKVSLGCFLVWLALVLATRYVSLGSIVAAVLAPVFSWYFDYPPAYIVFGGIAGLFVVIRHKENIKRLLNGTESKIKQGNAENIKK